MHRSLAPLVLLVAASSASCASFRAVTRGAFNDESTGRPAPALDAGTWVGEVPELANRWHLVAFIKPT